MSPACIFHSPPTPCHSLEGQPAPWGILQPLASPWGPAAHIPSHCSKKSPRQTSFSLPAVLQPAFTVKPAWQITSFPTLHHPSVLHTCFAWMLRYWHLPALQQLQEAEPFFASLSSPTSFLHVKYNLGPLPPLVDVAPHQLKGQSL